MLSNIKHYPQQAAFWFLDTVFPIRCIECKKFGRYLCNKCLQTISIKKTFECIGCKKPTPFGQTCHLCGKEFVVDQLLIAVDYKNSLLEKILKSLKYRFIQDLIFPVLVLVKKYLKWLTLEKKFNVFTGSPLLVSVPLHQRRLNWRGFNQAELLVKGLAETFQMEISNNLIVRTVNATPQADIKEKEKRLKNLEGVFKFVGNKNKLIGREILLIDDICTTGSTLNECARILKENGASKVVALVIARG